MLQKAIITPLDTYNSTRNRAKLASILLSGRDLVNSHAKTEIFQAYYYPANLGYCIDLDRPGFDNFKFFSKSKHYPDPIGTGFK